jgi:arylsulfatase A-like enzyme
VCHEPVINIDFYPTLLNYLKIKDSESEGKNMMPLLQGSDEFKRGAVFWHYPHYSNQGGTPGSAVRLGDYKLIEFYEDHHFELYNLKEDTGEQKNLVNEMPDETKRLKNLLYTWKDTMNVALPSPNPIYRE